jgi:hypothetical protein
VECTLRVSDAVSDIDIITDLRAQTVAAGLNVEVPREDWSLTRIN